MEDIGQTQLDFHTNTIIYLVVMSHLVRWIKSMKGLAHISEKNLAQDFLDKINHALQKCIELHYNINCFQNKVKICTHYYYWHLLL